MGRTEAAASAGSLRLGTLAVLIIAVGVVVAAALAPCLTAGVISFDDEQYVTNNQLVRNPSWNSTSRFLGEVLNPSTIGGYYQPLTMISLMLDCARGGGPDNLRPFHETSLALHMVNVSLVIVLLNLLFGNVYIAAAIGLVYGIHPQVVEPITWVGDRKTPLATLFALASLIAYVSWAGRQRPWLLIGSVATYILSLLAKPTTIMLPIAFLLIDYWPLRRLSLRACLEKTPFVLIMIVSAVVTYVSQKNTSVVILPRHGEDVPLLVGLIYRVVFYVEKMILPVDLTPLYPIPDPFSLANSHVLMRMFAGIVLGIGLVVSLRWTRSALVGGIMFFVLLAPTLGAIQFTHMIVADKYVYLPVVGLLITLTWWCGRGWDRLRMLRGPRFATALGLGALLVVVCLEFAGTRRYLNVWQDTQVFDTRKVAMAPRSALAHYDLGVTYGNRGRLEDAVACYRRALELDADNASAHNNLGTALLNLGRPDEALVHFRRAAELDLTLSSSTLNLANLLALQGQYPEAFDRYEQLLKQPKADQLQVHRNYGFALFKAGLHDRAVVQFEQAIAISGGDARVHCRLGSSLAAVGRRDEALRHFQEAMRLEPSWTEPAENAARLAQAATSPGS